MKTKIAEFGINDLLTGGLGLAVLGLALSYILQMNGDVRADMTANTYEYNASLSTSSGLGKITSKIGIIAGALAIGVVIAIIIKAFAFGNMGGQQ